jgi:hypothetical protein
MYKCDVTFNGMMHAYKIPQKSLSLNINRGGERDTIPYTCPFLQDKGK